MSLKWFAVVPLFLFAALPALGQVYTLADGNAHMDVSLTNQLLTQQLTLDCGLTVQGATGFLGDGLGLVSITQTGPNQLVVARSLFRVDAIVTYELHGGASGSGEASLTENYKLANAAFLNGPWRALQYNEYSLSDPSGPRDEAVMQDQNTFLQTGSPESLSILADQPASHYEINDPAPLYQFATQSSPDAHLLDSPPIGVPFPSSGRVASAFEWDSFLIANSVVNVATTTKHFVAQRPVAVPEPGSGVRLSTAVLVSTGHLIHRRQSMKRSR